MEILRPVLGIAIVVFAVTSTLSVGLQYTARQVIALGDVAAVIRALVAHIVLVPLLAFGILQVISLDRPFAIGRIMCSWPTFMPPV